MVPGDIGDMETITEIASDGALRVTLTAGVSCQPFSTRRQKLCGRRCLDSTRPMLGPGRAKPFLSRVAVQLYACLDFCDTSESVCVCVSTPRENDLVWLK